MQKKPNKLPYVFVEIDDSSDSDALDEIVASASLLPYRTPFPVQDPYISPAPYAQAPPVAPMGQVYDPYAQPPAPQYQPAYMPQSQYPSPYASRYADPFEDDDEDFQEPVSEELNFEHDSYDDSDDVVSSIVGDLDDRDSDIYESVEETADYEPTSLTDEEYDEDFEYDFDEGDDYSKSSSEKTSSRYKETAEEPDTLNLETVVIPVFKDASALARTNSDALAQIAGAQAAMAPNVSPYQALPFAYSQFRAPFINPAWAYPQALAQNAMGQAFGQYVRAGMQMGAPSLPYSSMPGGAARAKAQGRPTMPSSNAVAGADSYDAVKGASSRPYNRQSSVPSAHQRSNDNVTRGQAPSASNDYQVPMPAEARSALASGNASSSKPSLRKNASQNRSSSSSAALKKPQSPDASSASRQAQTITASTDSVSVSVSVLAPDSQMTAQSSSQRPNPASGSSSVAASSRQPQAQRTAQAQTRPSPSQVPSPTMRQSSSSVSNGAKPKAAPAKHQKETFEEKAMRENAEKTHTSLNDSDDPTQVGRPLLDANAIATSDMFSRPADSLNDNMHARLKSSGRKRALVIIIVSLILALVVAAVVCLIAVWSGLATISFDESNVPAIQINGLDGADQGAADAQA